MQFADFVSVGFNQIVNNLAKSHYRWAQPADVLVRMPTGAGVAQTVSQPEYRSVVFRCSRIKIGLPINPFDAKGLLASCINDPNPILFFEHKALYRSIRR